MRSERLRSTVFAGMVVVLGVTGSVAASGGQAGACTEAQSAEIADTTRPPPGPAAHKGVTDKVLTMVPLANEKVGLKEHSLRLRRLVVQPGGVVAWHSHADRPAIINVVSGDITEYSTHCAVPIVHRAGETSTESGGLSHWWRNHTNQPVVLLSADLLHDHNDHHM